MLNWADEHGIVVIDETAAVGFNLSLGIGFEAGNKPKNCTAKRQSTGKLSKRTYRRLKS
ncbi:glycoside hydrolase family 2 TIM barrel-domain containing protein [Escherichia coli]